MRRTLPTRKKIKRDATPRVIYLIGFLAYAAWGGWAWVLFNLAPEGVPNQLVFLGTSFLALFLTFLFLFYQAAKEATGKAPPVVFYPAARRAFFVAFFFPALGVMKLLGIFNLINAGLLSLILLLVEIQISRG
ncbi:hypothetical protein GTO10_02220 [Candidatus Saccharibacteria bacterium]|nr:hypothetical protein [Candidatus Saccharibacteria bacterium]